MAKLSEWLEIMIDEVARKRDAAARAAAEQAARDGEKPARGASPAVEQPRS